MFVEDIIVYLMILVPILLFVIGIVLISLKKLVDLGRALVLLSVLFVLFWVDIFGAIILAYEDGDSGFYIAMLLVFSALFVLFVASALWKFIKKKHFYIPFCICTVVCIIATVGVFAFKKYEENLPVVSENEYLLVDYVPYADGTKVAELDGESTLLITNDFPKIDGATAMYPVYSAFAKAVYPETLINEDHPYAYLVNEYLKCNTTAKAYESIVTGEADIIFVSDPSAEQMQFAKDNGVELVYTPILKEAFVFFVNGRNPLDDVSMSQIKGIYSGEITRWSDLDVDRLGNIRAFQREEGSGSQSALVKIMDGTPLMTPLEEDRISGMMGIITRTADYKNYKNALGYSFRFYCTDMVSNDQIKLLSIDGVAPTAENIENGTYPSVSYFYAVTRSDVSENTQKLVEWILSEQGQKLVAKTGYTPLNEDECADAVEAFLESTDVADYNAYRPDYGIGECTNLRGDITVALFYFDDFESEWNEHSITQFTTEEVESGLRFLEYQASEYGVNLNFDLVEFDGLYYNDKVEISSAASGFVTIDSIYQAATQLGYSSDFELLEYLRSEYDTNEVICIALFNKNGTGYGINPQAGIDAGVIEHCVVFSSDLYPTGNETKGSQASVIANEILFLYGAESFTKIESRKALAQTHYPDDIMLSQAYYVYDNNIGEATAFYIGWINKVPQTVASPEWRDTTAQT